MSARLALAETTMAYVVTEAMGAAVLTDADAAAKRLAERYAEAIDTAEDPDEALKDFGPKLLQVLTALRCTPAARGAAKPEPSRGGNLAKLRAARSA